MTTLGGLLHAHRAAQERQYDDNSRERRHHHEKGWSERDDRDERNDLENTAGERAGLGTEIERKFLCGRGRGEGNQRCCRSEDEAKGAGACEH